MTSQNPGLTISRYFPACVFIMSVDVIIQYRKVMSVQQLINCMCKFIKFEKNKEFILIKLLKDVSQ